jgi:PAS domain S-box-containing protein
MSRPEMDVEEPPEREGDYRLVLDSIPQGIWIIAADGVTEFVNRHGAAYVGLSDEAPGGRWPGPVHPDDAGRVDTAWRRAESTKTPCELEYRLRRADGDYRWNAVHGTPLQSRGAAVGRWLWLCIDIEQHKRVAEQLRELQAPEPAGRAGGSVRHEFNNLLTAILGYGTLIRDRLPAGDPLRADAEEVLAAAERAHALAAQLVASARREP